MGSPNSIEIGYALSSEETQPQELIRLAAQAEATGFTFALISDHFHPWAEIQGSSPFVWSVLGGIATQTRHLRVGTGVTCPIKRMHPAIVAQASATMGCLMPGRFFLGLGSGESLNEHVVGGVWPPPDVRQDMLEEAVSVLRLLHRGGEQSHQGRFFQVDDARIYNLPEQPVPIYLAASGGRSAKLAGSIADGLISTSPSKDTVSAFNSAGGDGKPRIGQLTVCWAKSYVEGLNTAHKHWAVSGLKGQFKNELPRPAHLEQATSSVTVEDVAMDIVCGPDPARHIEAIQKFISAGFDQVYVHQVGPDQAGFMRFYEREIIPNLRTLAA